VPNSAYLAATFALLATTGFARANEQACGPVNCPIGTSCTNVGCGFCGNGGLLFCPFGKPEHSFPANTPGLDWYTRTRGVFGFAPSGARLGGPVRGPSETVIDLSHQSAVRGHGGSDTSWIAGSWQVGGFVRIPGESSIGKESDGRYGVSLGGNFPVPYIPLVGHLNAGFGNTRSPSLLPMTD
jgi:hypothetical protein